MAFDNNTPLGNEKIRLTDEKILANFVAIGTCLNLSAGVLRTFPATTPMAFYLDAAPTLWTINNTLDDKLLFVTKGSVAGGETGGGTHATGTWTIAGLTKDAHTHSFTQPNNHTALALSNHTALSLNTESTHTHTGPSHAHTISADGDHSHTLGAGAIISLGANVASTTSTDGQHNHGGVTGNAGTGATSAGTAHGHTFSQDIDAHSFSQNITAHAGGAVGAQSDAAISSAGTWRPDSYCVIICTKD